MSWAAICHLRLVSDGWAEEPETTRRKAVDLARQALQVAENDPGVLANAAFVLAHFGEDIGAMIGWSTVRWRSTRASPAAGM